MKITTVRKGIELARMVLVYILFTATFFPTFIAQKIHLDAIEGGRKPELSNFFAHLIIPLLFLPLLAVVFLPAKPLNKLIAGSIVGGIFVPIALLALIIFQIFYSCERYANCF